MTPFALLLQISGLSQREAANFLRISPAMVDKMSRGVRATPRGVLTELRGLIERQEKAADTALQIIEDSAPPEIDIGYPVDDREAQARGWPCVGAWRGMAARVVAAVDAPVLLVPAGAAVGTAAASDKAGR